MKAMLEAGRTLAEARAFALQLSRKNANRYVTLYACFGLFASVTDKLHVHAPGDSVGESYWLNGKEKPFTTAQYGADQRATPALS